MHRAVPFNNAGPPHSIYNQRLVRPSLSVKLSQYRNKETALRYNYQLADITYTVAGMSLNLLRLLDVSNAFFITRNQNFDAFRNGATIVAAQPE